MNGSSLIRSFVAIDCPAGSHLQEAIRDWRDALEDARVRWVDPAQLHLTLAFLGEVEPAVLEMVGDGLQKSFGRPGSFPIRLKGMGIFGRIMDPRVIWIGVEPCSPLNHLKTLTDEVIRAQGILPDTRPFSPHITLGRPKQLPQTAILRELLRRYQDRDLQEVEVKEVVLYESRLASGGPEYISLRKYTL